jgi:26S proteasome regulatory subunit N7
LKELDEKIADAEKNLGESEIREAMLAKSDYLLKIGDKDKAVSAYRQTYEKTVPIGQRLDIIFTLIRIGFFWQDHIIITRNIEKAKSLVEEGGDWDRRNRLKVYEAFYSMGVRDFPRAATLFLETLSTFASYELFSYNTFIDYTVIMSLVALDRNKLKSKVIHAPEILQVIENIQSLEKFMTSFYNSSYSDFFDGLADITERIKRDWVLYPHTRYFCREMRIRAYSQLLESYRSVQLTSIAQHFGVPAPFIDTELSRFIASGRLHAKIDKVGGIVETTRPDAKNAQYQTTIKQGDLLLNRIQKLSRVINL